MNAPEGDAVLGDPADAARSAARPDAHPCLSCNTYTEEEKKRGRVLLTGYQKRMAQVVTWKMELLERKYGVNRLMVIHLTPREAWDHTQWARAFKGLLAHCLSKAYSDYLLVMERGSKGGRLHGHLVVACKEDVRTGYDFAARAKAKTRGAQARWRTGANAALRAEMKRWDSGSWDANTKRWTGKGKHLAYGFGYTRVEPVVAGQAFAYYLGGYVAKNLANRAPGDASRRLVRSSKGLNNFTVHFQFLNARTYLYRRKVEAFCTLNEIKNLDELAEKAGRRWAYDLGPIIFGTPLKRWETFKYFNGRKTLTVTAAMLAGMDGIDLPPDFKTSDSLWIECAGLSEVRWGWLRVKEKGTSRGWDYRYEVTWNYANSHGVNGVAHRPERPIFSEKGVSTYTEWNPGAENALPDGNPF